MPLDQDRYNALIARASFRAEFFRGTIQDLSNAQRAMSFTGSPTWGKANGWPCLLSPPGAGVTSGAIPPVLDVTQALWAEVLFSEDMTGVHYLMSHVGVGNAGGLLLVASGGSLALYLFNLAAASRTATVTISLRRTTHAIIAFAAGGASASAWVFGAPVAPALAGAAVPANFAGNRPLLAASAGTAAASSMIVRLWQGTPMNEETSCLAEQARLLVGGW